MKPVPVSEDNLFPDLTNDSDRFKSSHIDIIEAYLQCGGDGIVLTGHQEGILDRLRFADEKIRQGHGRFKREEVVGFIKARFGVSRDTAMKDIINAERVFSSSYPLNKSYEIGIQIESVKESIRLAKGENDWKAVAMLHRDLAKYLEMYPDIIQADTKKNIILNVLQQFFDTPEAAAGGMGIDEALQIAESIDLSEDE